MRIEDKPSEFEAAARLPAHGKKHHRNEERQEKARNQNDPVRGEVQGYQAHGEHQEYPNGEAKKPYRRVCGDLHTFLRTL
jgi:hypothetical protein